jgi:hypothetical protein
MLPDVKITGLQGCRVAALTTCSFAALQLCHYFHGYRCRQGMLPEVKIACAVGRMSPPSNAVSPESSAATSAAHHETSLFLIGMGAGRHVA